MAKVEYCRVAAVVAALECGKVGDCRSCRRRFARQDCRCECYRSTIRVPENGDDANACLGMLHLEQRRIGVLTGAIDREAVEVDAELISADPNSEGVRRTPRLVSACFWIKLIRYACPREVFTRIAKNYGTEQDGKDDENGDEPCGDEQGTAKGSRGSRFVGIRSRW